MPIVRSKRLAGTYRDSVLLMKVSQEAAERSGARRVAAMMGSPRNKELLARLDLATDETEAARPDELVISIEADPPLMERAFEVVLELLNNPSPAQARGPCSAVSVPRSLEEALEECEGARIALISVPGEYARYEAAQALAAGLDVMLYSGDIGPADEKALKKMAAAAGRLLMGPDCGTAIINHVPLGFANNVRRGAIGIVSSSGTGIQEVSCLLDRCGLGISSAYGTGGRDLSDDIGGLAARAALSRLRRDPETRMILVIGKDVGPATRSGLLEACVKCGKPVLACYLGAGDYAAEERAGIRCATNLTELARMAALFAAPVLDISEMDRPGPPQERHGKGLLRAVYSGGALCREAAEIALPILTEGLAGQACSSNFRMPGCAYVPGAAPCHGHGFVDMGASEFTGGRPHPLLNPALKMERLLAELCDPDVAVVLTDIVLGFGVTPGEAVQLVRARNKAAHLAGVKSRNCAIVTSVCGTDSDPVSRSPEVAFLRQAGVLVAGSNARAAAFAARLARGGPPAGRSSRDSRGSRRT